jgi:hypothetical protein
MRLNHRSEMEVRESRAEARVGSQLCLTTARSTRAQPGLALPLQKQPSILHLPGGAQPDSFALSRPDL